MLASQVKLAFERNKIIETLIPLPHEMQNAIVREAFVHVRALGIGPSTNEHVKGDNDSEGGGDNTNQIENLNARVQILEEESAMVKEEIALLKNKVALQDSFMRSLKATNLVSTSEDPDLDVGGPHHQEEEDWQEEDNLDVGGLGFDVSVEGYHQDHGEEHQEEERQEEQWEEERQEELQEELQELQERKPAIPKLRELKGFHVSPPENTIRKKEKTIKILQF